MSNFTFVVPKLVDAGAWLDWRKKYEGGHSMYGTRDVSKVNFVVAHHSVTNPSGNAETDINTIANIHINGNDWDGIGYNFIITSEEVNGYAKVAYVGDLASIRAHTPNTRGAYNLPRGRGNEYLIAACFVGQNHLKEPTPAQIRSANALFGEMLFNEKERMPTLYGGWNDMKAHYDFDQTKCNGLPQIIKMIRDYKDPAPKNAEKPVFTVRALGQPVDLMTRVGTRVRDLVTGKTTRQYNRAEPFEATHTLEYKGEKYYMTDWSFGQYEKGKNPTAAKAKDLDKVKEPTPIPTPTPPPMQPPVAPVEKTPQVPPKTTVDPPKPDKGDVNEKPNIVQKPTKDTNKKPSTEASKMIGRKGVMGAVSVALVACADWAVSSLMGVELPNELKVSLGGILYAIIAWIDKYLHERAKQVETKIKGLIGF